MTGLTDCDVRALVNPNYPAADHQLRELQVAAAATGLQIDTVTAGTQRDINAPFASLVQQGINVLLVANDPFFQSRRDQIVALAARHAIAASYPGREFVDAVGLVSYGPSLTDTYRLAGKLHREGAQRHEAGRSTGPAADEI